MVLNVSTNFPQLQTISSYLLVDSSEECNGKGTDCVADAECNATGTRTLPSPGRYYLCVAADGWRGHYLPWGTAALEVAALVSPQLYLMVDGSITIRLFDTSKRTRISGMNMFLVRCLQNGCPHTTLKDGIATVVDVDHCVKAAQGHPKYLSNGAVLPVNEGVHALCVDHSQEDGVFPCGDPGECACEALCL